MATTSKNINHYVLILCGGSGPRLWPLSRAEYPKQFLKLFGENSILEDTITRCLSIAPPQNIFLISNQKYSKTIEDITKKYLPLKNILYEPLKRNTTMAILYGSTYINNLNPDAIITCLPSDHLIKNVKKFKNDVIKSSKLAQEHQSIVTIGFKPQNPTPSYGYISINKKNHNYVLDFIEKPDKKTATRLIKQNYYWNTDILTFTHKTLLEEIKLYQPQYLKLYTILKDNLNNRNSLEHIYTISPNLSIAYAISEKTKKLIMLPGSFYWSDIGEWKSIYNQLKKDKNGIVQLNPNTHYVQVNSRNCLISTSGSKLIGLVDVNNLAIIDTPDALLICNIAYDGSFRVRDIVNRITKDKSLENYFLKIPKND